ncbi:MAG: hypothetical protein JWO38_3168 [Gemmataceae bacterium]|nr:hypothetical protein [Gemmataceae bacterium]
MLVVRSSRSVDGDLCKTCIHKHFWGTTGLTLVPGRWGTISLIVTPFFLLNNVGRYLFCLGMPGVPPGAAPPTLTADAIERIKPHLPALIDRLNAGEDFASVTKTVAYVAGVTPGQVVLFIQAMAHARAGES